MKTSFSRLRDEKSKKIEAWEFSDTRGRKKTIVEVFSCELKSKTCFKLVSPNGFAVPFAEKKYVERLILDFRIQDFRILSFFIRNSSKIQSWALGRNEYWNHKSHSRRLYVLYDQLFPFLREMMSSCLVSLEYSLSKIKFPASNFQSLIQTLHGVSSGVLNISSGISLMRKLKNSFTNRPPSSNITSNLNHKVKSHWK